MADKRYYNLVHKETSRFINKWDVLALLLIFAILCLFAWGGKQMSTPYRLGEPLAISLDPHVLPMYAIRTVLRMGIGLIFSLLFTFTIGTWAAKSYRAGQVIIPTIDVLQAVPVLSFLSITITGFIALFPNSLLGPECAAIFAIFTAQAWNMALGFYQTLRTVPNELKEAAKMFRLSPWQRFWRVEVPFSMSSLLWNTMMSMSASWFFVVLSEAISVSNQTIRLPGIGSYIDLAIEQENLAAVGYAILTMFVVILFYDQLLFRPLLSWSEKFKIETEPGETTSQSWVITLMEKTRLLKFCGRIFIRLGDSFVNNPRLQRTSTASTHKTSPMLDLFWKISVTVMLLLSSLSLIFFITKEVELSEIVTVLGLGLATTLRVFCIILVSSLIWVPIGVGIGLRPNLAKTLQPIIQFVASFPANLFYPLVGIAILTYHLNTEIWLTPLMILGTQWYILFNVIAGASAIPKDIYLVADNFGVKGWQWWRTIALPGIFPYYITGAITAAGGAWNASIVVEWVSWGDTTLTATGLGAYIHQYTTAGDFPRTVLGTVIMCCFVLFFNRFVWRPLYQLAEARFQITV